jgi:KipI family sensor histidine kinase inhibitor
MPEVERPYLSFAPLGDRALLVEVGETVDQAVTARLRELAGRIAANNLAGVTDIVPSFCSIALHYEPMTVHDSADGRTPYDALVERLQLLLADVEERAPREGRLFEIPVVYGGELGEDLLSLAQSRGLTPEEASEIHSAPVYTVYMLGFAPGFAYMGPVDARLQEPRRSAPRAKVAAGSVALANEYTGIYPMDLPGGWHVIGRTPWRFFDAQRDPPALLAAGDRVRFVPISPADFDAAARGQPWR